MNPSTSFSSFTRRTLAAALILFIAGLAACGGDTSSSSADSGVTLAQFNALQAQVNALSSTVTKLQTAEAGDASALTTIQANQTSDAGTLATIQTNQAADEKSLTKVEAFGHSRSAVVAAARAARTEAIDIGGSPRTQAITFGPCADMGQAYGNASPDPISTTVKYYKQCPINGVQYVYGATVQTGTITQSAGNVLWFDQPNCTGNALIFENDGSYNRITLQGGVVFDSPVDGTTELMVVAGQAGNSMTSQSIYDGTAHTCNNVSETHPGYLATANDINVTGVPASVPSDFID